MLGTKKIQNFINLSDGISMNPSVSIEINKNSVSSPYLYGTGNAPEISSIPANFSSVGSAPAPTTVNRGQKTSIYPNASCQLMISKSDSGSAIVTKISVSNGVATLTTSKPHSINSGDDINAFGFSNSALNGSFIALSGTRSNVIRYNTGVQGLNIASKDLKKRGTVEYDNNEYVSQKTTNLPVKFFMKLKSDYEYQTANLPSPSTYAFVEDFYVNIKVIGMKGGKYLYTQIVNKRVNVNASGWTNVQVGFANPDEEYDSVRLLLSFDSSAEYRAALLVDQLVCVEVSDYEIYVENRMPLFDVFDSFRPGEVLVDYPERIRKIPTSINPNFPQQCTPVHMASQYALGKPLNLVQRSITPYAGNPCNYYVSGSSSESKRAWAIYDSPFKSNKIVIKVNAVASKPSRFTIKLLINNEWETIKYNSTPSFDEHGVLRLYKNGNSWSTSKWSSPPILSEVSGDISEYVEIQGIYFQCNQIEYSYPSSPLSKEPAIKILELIEISPRLEVDMSRYVIDLTIDKEMSETSDIPLPFGMVSSSVATVQFSNIPILLGRSDVSHNKTQDDVTPISNFAKNSPFNSLLVKGAKVICKFNIDYRGVKESVPAFHMYVDRWVDSIGSPDFKITAECFDVIQKLHSTKVRPLYFKNHSINEIIFGILDSVGFAEYSFRQLNSLNILQGLKYNSEEAEFNKSKKRIPHYWTDKNKSVTETLNEIFKVYQISMFVDEYGIVRFSSLNSVAEELSKMIDSNEKITRLQDFTNDTNKSNIVSLNFEVEDPVKEIILNYRQPRPTLSDPDYFDSEKDKNRILIKKAREVVWEPAQGIDVLTFIELSPPGIVSKTQNKIKYDPVLIASSPTRTIKNSGYLLVDQEIIKYDGVEYQFTTPNDPEFSYLDVVKSQEDIQSIVDQLLIKYNFSKIVYGQTGFLMNVERGLFGTTAEKHPVEFPGKRTNWLAREFNEKFESVNSIEEDDGKFTSDVGKIKISCSKDSGGIFLYPPENNVVGRKRKFAMNYYISDVPSNKEGALGAAIGVTIENNKITNGLFIFTGLSPKKKTTEVNLIVKQVYTEGGTTKIDTLTSKKTLDFTDTELIAEKQPLELYIAFNEDMNSARMFIGTNSIFQEKKPIKDKNGKPNKKEKVFKPVDVKLKPINKRGLFGLVSSGTITGFMDSLAFTIKSDPRNFNDVNITDLDSDYEGDNDSKIGKGYYIGADSLLTQLAYDQFIDGINKFKDGFVWNGSPNARGINIYNVDYDVYPVIETPSIIFNGYTYTSSSSAASFFYEGKGLPGGD
jgi:hypothetical protein